MAVILDPQHRELALLFELAGRWRAGCILEVGCGHGRLTRAFAPQAASVLAIDPDPDEIALARLEMPDGLGGRIEWRANGIEELVARDASFDLVLFSWALC